MTADRVSKAAAEVRKYWRDWPQERRDGVRALSGHLADAIEELAAAVEVSPRGRCGTCDRSIGLTKSGVLRQHNGDIYEGIWRRICKGTGELPAVAS
jgi:hypothetical protein